MPPCLGGKSLVTISVRRMAPASLRAGGAVEAVRVPGRVHAELADRLARRWRVDDHAVADVYRDVADAVVVKQVTRLDLGRGDVRERGPLAVSVARDRDARRRPGLHHQAGAVEADAARAGGAIA